MAVQSIDPKTGKPTFNDVSTTQADLQAVADFSDPSRNLTFATAAALPATSFAGQRAYVNADPGGGNGLYVSNGSGWTRTWSPGTPYAFQAGTGANAADGTAKTVNFAAGRFTVAPIVTMANTGGSVYALNYQSATKTSALMGGYDDAGNGIPNASWSWTAVQMTPTSAAG